MKSSKNKPGLLKRIFSDHYTVTLYTQEDDGTTGVMSYELKELKKITSTYFKGVTLEGEKVEFRTHKPFDYRVVKHY